MISKLFDNKKVKLNHIPSTHESIFRDYQNQVHPSYDAVFSFVYSLEEMNEDIIKSMNLLEPGGMLYLCYPKLKNKCGLTGIHRDHIFPYLHVDQKTGYVKNTLMRFNKMLSFDDDYTLLAVKKDITKKERSQTSQKVDDYIDRIEDIKQILKHETCYQFFMSLTPGYQKGWARYIFSAKTDETKEKRINEMIDLLGQGVKSKDLARKG